MGSASGSCGGPWARSLLSDILCSSIACSAAKCRWEKDTTSGQWSALSTRVAPASCRQRSGARALGPPYSYLLATLAEYALSCSICFSTFAQSTVYLSLPFLSLRDNNCALGSA